MEFCTKCQKNVIVFQQHVITMPQDEQNERRHYLETFCALCGNCIKRDVEDTKDEDSVGYTG